MKRRYRIFNTKMISNLIIVLIGILFFLLLSNLGSVGSVIDSVFSIIAPFLWGFFVAYLLNTPTKFFMRKVYKKYRFKRAFSIATVYLIALIVVGLILALIIPQVIDSLITLVNNLPVYMDNLNDLVRNFTSTFGIQWDDMDNVLSSYEDLLSRLFESISAELPNVVNYGIALGSGIISAIVAIISSVYMLSGKDRLVRQIKSILYAVFPTKRVHSFLITCRQGSQIFISFVNGKLIDSAIVGVLCAILCVILQIPLVPLISVVIGVTNIIPFFGPFIGAIPSILILLMIDPWAALRFAIMIIVLQQVDGNIIGPKILGNYTGLSPIWVLVAIVVGGGLFGIIGMIIGVPVFAVIYMLVRRGVTNRLKKKDIDSDGRALHRKSEDGPKDPDGPDPGGTDPGSPDAGEAAEETESSSAAVEDPDETETAATDEETCSSSPENKE